MVVRVCLVEVMGWIFLCMLMGCTSAENDDTVKINQQARAILSNPKLATETSPKNFKTKFTTTRGEFIVEVVREWALNGADRFYNLIKTGYYNQTYIFRIPKPRFVVQWGIHGDPAVSNRWKAFPIKDDKVTQTNTRGSMGFSGMKANTRSTQVYINLKDNSLLDNSGYAPFARVIQGMDVVDAMYDGYGASPPFGKGPVIAEIYKQGNVYLEKNFPKLDFIEKAELME